jgi:hypothetical protein
MQVQIPWPTSSTKDVPQRAGSGQLVNAIMELVPDGRINRKRAPGLAQFGTSVSGAVHCRGMILANDSQMLVVYNDAIEVMAPDGSSSALGVLNGTGLVTLAKNIKTPVPDIVCVAGTQAYVVSAGAAPIPYPDADIGSPNSVCFGDGYFFFTYGSGQCTASAVNGTAINPLDTIFVNSSSSELLRGVFFAQTLFLFARDTIEAWTNTANPIGFPFSRSAVIPRGLISPFAIAGYEKGFTATLIFVGSDNIVYLMRGYDPVRISTSDIERRISNVSNKTTLRACVYMSEGHAIWQLTSSDFTLCFDLTNTYWFERNSNGQNFSRIETSQNGFGKWLVGDYATGKVGSVSASTYSEYGETLTYRVQSFPTNNFPTRRVVRKADFNFITGVGLTPNTTPYDLVTDPYANPRVLVSWSDDGGASFTMPLERTIGKVGETNRVATVLRSGQAQRYGRVWRIEATDPVYIGLVGGSMEAA